MDVLRTPRLLLRRWDDTCLEGLIHLAADPRVMRHIGPGAVWDAARTREKHRDVLRHWDERGYGWRVALDRSHGAVVGLGALNRLGSLVPGLDEAHVEIGWWFIPRVWGRGLASEGAKALRNEAFSRVHAECVVGRYHPVNVASGRIMDRLGMTRHSDHIDQWGLPVTVKTLCRAEWQRLARAEREPDV